MDTRQRILEAAREAYGQKGFRGATTRRIAALARVNEVTIFRQFGSKQALLTEALSDQPGGTPPPSALPGVPSDPAAELSDWTEAHLRSLAKRGQVLRASIGDQVERPELADGILTLQKQALAELSGYLERVAKRERPRASVDSRAAAAMLIAVLFADATRNDASSDDPGISDRARSYATVVLTALGVAETETPSRQTASAPPPPFLPDATGA